MKHNQLPFVGILSIVIVLLVCACGDSQAQELNILPTIESLASVMPGQAQAIPTAAPTLNVPLRPEATPEATQPAVDAPPQAPRHEEDQGILATLTPVLYSRYIADCPGANLRVCMGGDCAVIAFLEHGALIQVSVSQNDWYLVHLDDGQTGYISSFSTTAFVPDACPGGQQPGVPLTPSGNPPVLPPQPAPITPPSTFMPAPLPLPTISRPITPPIAPPPTQPGSGVLPPIDPPRIIPPIVIPPAPPVMPPDRIIIPVLPVQPIRPIRPIMPVIPELPERFGGFELEGIEVVPSNP